jgi:hypothetical protein
MKILALSNIKHDQEEYPTGSIFEINDDSGKILVDSGVARLSTREDELVAEAKAKAAEEEKSGKSKSARTRKPAKPSSKREVPDLQEFTLNGKVYKHNVTSTGQDQYRAGGRMCNKTVFEEALAEYKASQE